MQVKNYFKNFAIFDFISWLTVSFAALSLWAAFGVQSWLWAFSWMLWAAIIPIIAGLFWWTKVKVSWPTAPMTAVSMLVISYAFQTFWTDGYTAYQFITAVFILTWIILILFWIFKLWNLVTKIPNVVVIWFMDWIALLIWFDQFKTLFWLYWKHSLEWPLFWNVFFAVVTFIFIVLFPFLIEKIKIHHNIKSILSPTLVAIVLFTSIILLTWIKLETVQLWNTISSFNWFISQIQNYFPTEYIFTNWNIFQKVLSFSLQLAILWYLDSLLTSVIIDRMTNTKTKKNKELIAQWLANWLSWFLWWLPWAQATIRSVLLIKEWAKTRIAWIMVWFFTLFWMFLFKSYILLIPVTVFIWILFKVWLDVFDLKYIKDYIKNWWYKDKVRNIQVIFVLYTLFVTVFVNLNVAVFSATILYYIAKHFNIVMDLEDEENSTELLKD